ncbi:MAG: hypothetical protein DDT41_01452 [candidate division WS2 bacterium]|nr:hypothetical protein [Candidatus Psychracetigena formicireducens]
MLMGVNCVLKASYIRNEKRNIILDWLINYHYKKTKKMLNYLNIPENTFIRGCCYLIF